MEQTEILLIDDSKDDALLTARTVEKARVANPIRHFDTGQAALYYLTEVLKDKPEAMLPAVILLDLKMAGMSGLEVLKALNRNPRFKGVLRVVLSNLHDLNSIKEAHAAGANSFLIKPLNPSDILNLIASYPAFWIRESRGR